MRLNDSEWTVMQALWAGAPATAREVLERIEAETDWAYTTVKTLLDRLAAKGAVSVEMQGHQSAYTPLVSQRTARRTALRSLVDRAFDGAFGSLVQHLAAEERLTPDERRQLREMAERLDRKGRRS